MITLSLVFAAAAAPLAAQQTAAAAPAAQAAGPRVDNSLARVQPKFATSSSTSLYQDNVYVNHSYLIYILVVAVLIVLLVILLRRA